MLDTLCRRNFGHNGYNFPLQNAALPCNLHSGRITDCEYSSERKLPPMGKNATRCFQSLQKLRACTLVCNGLRLLDRNYFLLRSISILSQDKRANMTLYPRFFSSWMVRGQIATHLKIRCPQTWQPAMRSASQFLYAKMVKCRRRRRRRHLALHHYPQLPWWENLLHRHLWH